MNEYIVEEGEYKNIKWKLDMYCKLTISGEGDMPDWEIDSLYKPAITPWYDAGVENQIEQVIIEPGITSVGTGAFDRCTCLQEVILPESVKVIKAYAFNECRFLSSINVQNVVCIEEQAFGHCHSLKSLELSDDLEFIGASAFMDSGLKSIDIPPEVTSIEDCTFLGCQHLEKINIPKSVKSIKDEFSYCYSLISINVDPENEDYTSVDGVLYDKNQTKLILYPPKKEDKVFEIPQTVTETEHNSLFYCENLEEIRVKKNLRTGLGFYKNPSLKKIVVSEENPYYSSLDGVLFNKDKTTLMKYPDNKEGDYKIPETVNKIKIGAFNGVNRLKNLYISSNVCSIDDFYECESLENVDVAENNEHFASTDGVLFNKEYEELVYYPQNKPDKYYVIPSSVTATRAGAFNRCNNLERLYISENVEVFGDTELGLSDCTKLRGIDVDENNKQYSSMDGILMNKSNSSLIIYPPNKDNDDFTVPYCVKEIKFHAFYKNNHIREINIPCHIAKIERYAFDECENLIDINVADGIYHYFDGTLWDTYNQWVIWDSQGNYRQEWKIWEYNNYSIEALSDLENISCRFSEQEGRLTVSGTGAVPRRFAEILESHQKGIQEKIRKVIIEDGITAIRNNAFEDCYNLTEVVLPSGMEYIENSAFKNCKTLQKINISQELKSIGNKAFNGCLALEKVELSDSENLTGMGKKAFGGCETLKRIVIPPTVKYVDMSAFVDCKSLTEIVIPKETEYMPMWYGGCDSLEKFTVSEDNEFYSSDNGVLYDKNKTRLIWYPTAKKEERYTLPSSLTSVHNMSDNQYVKYIYIPKGVKLNSFFYFSWSIEYVEVSEDNEDYTSVDGVLYDKECRKLIYYPPGRKTGRYDILPTTESIGIEAFCNQHIKTVFVPSSVKDINCNAFRPSKSLECIELDDHIKDFEIKDGKLIDCKDCTVLWDISELHFD